MNRKILNQCIMIQPEFCGSGWVLTFPCIKGSKLITPKYGFKTFEQARKRALVWQRRLSKICKQKFPVAMNDTRYSCIGRDSIRYQIIA